MIPGFFAAGAVGAAAGPSVPEAEAIWDKLDSSGRWYEFSEAAGSVCIDSHNGMDGVYHNAPSLRVGGGPDNSPFGVSFDGVNQSATVPHLGMILGGGSWTILQFIRLSNTIQTDRYLLCVGTQQVQVGMLYGYVSETVELFGPQSDTNPRPGSQIELDDTSLHQVGYTYSSTGNNRRGLLDGADAFSETRTMVLSANTADSHVAKAVPNNNHCAVTYYQLVAAPASLTPAEVAYLYNGGAGRSYAQFKAEAGH